MVCEQVKAPWELTLGNYFIAIHDKSGCIILPETDYCINKKSLVVARLWEKAPETLDAAQYAMDSLLYAKRSLDSCGFRGEKIHHIDGRIETIARLIHYILTGEAVAQGRQTCGGENGR